MNQKKRKNDEDMSCFQQIVGCSNLFIRLLAGLLSLIFIGTTLFLFYMKFEFPEFDITIWVVITSFFAYLCGYIAINQSKEKFPHKPKAIGQEIFGFVRLIAWVASTFIMIIAGFSIILTIGMLFSYPESSAFIMLIICIILTIVFGYLAKVLRPVRKSGSVQNVLDEDKLKNDWLKDDSDENDDD